MAHRLRLHKIARQVHYLASLVLVVFALLYAITGIVMTRHTWFPPGEATVVTTAHALVVAPDTTNLPALGQNLKHEFGLSGRTAWSRNWRNDIVFDMIRPGCVHNVRLHAALDSVTIRTTTKKTIAK